MNRLPVRAIAIFVATVVSIVIAVVTGAWAQTSSPAKRTDPKINEPFKNPDVKGFIQKFESEDREVYAKRAEIVAALGLRPGMSVADVGAGTGLFTRLLHVRAGQDVFRREIQAAGFRFEPVRKPPEFKETFFLRFEKSSASLKRSAEEGRRGSP